MKSKRRYFYNALLLTAVAFLMRSVSVAFNVYVSNRVGAEAMGLLSLISSVYGFSVTLATSGIHLATVRTVSEHLEMTHGADNRRCIRAALSYAACFGTLATLLLFFLAAPIATHLLKETRCIRALRMLSLTLLPIALSSVLNGYFTAVRRAWKNAVAQVSEQSIKITLTGYLLVIVAPKTTEGCVLAVLMGGAVAETLSLLLNFLLYLLDKRHFRGIVQRKTGAGISVASVALPVAVSAYMRSGLISVEHMLIPRGLAKFGLDTATALSAYGALHSMALPVVLYPTALLSSFAALLIPEVTEQQAAGNPREIRYIAGRVYQMTLLFSIGTAAVMLLLSGELGRVLYESREVAQFIRLLAPLIPIMYLDTATDALLKGLGEQVYSMNVNITDALVSVVAVSILVPRMGIHGYLVTIYITEILNAALSVCRLLKVSGFRPQLRSLLLRPLGAAIGAACLSHLLFTFSLPHTKESGGTLVLHILLTVLFYVLLLFLTGALHPTDAKWMLFSLFEPKSKKGAASPHNSARKGETF